MNLSQFTPATYWWRIRALAMVLGKPKISNDRFWFECQLDPKLGRQFTGINIPELPPQQVQERFTGRSGRLNLLQAFEFYKHVCTNCGLDKKNLPKVLDFGGGWGRIARFFLRDTNADKIWVADVLSDSIYWLEATEAKFSVLKNNPLPPIEGADGNFDVIYAFSVFSHLAESHFISWVTYLLSLLAEGGHLVFTSRGTNFISQLAASAESYSLQRKDWNLPEPRTLSRQFAEGRFQFYSTGGGGELTEDFYGEAFVPVQFVKDHFGRHFVSATESVPHSDQTVFILKK